VTRRRAQGGQASVELVAALPALGLAVVLAAHLVMAGYALWSAGVAARAGARAELVGGDARRAARALLPSVLRERASVGEGSPVRVRLRAPSLVPGLPGVPLSVRAGLGPGNGHAR
jgi:hypothetical protein